MRLYVVRKDKEKFSISEENFNTDSMRYRYMIKHYPMFSKRKDAQNYVLECMNPTIEERKIELEKMNRKRFEENLMRYKCGSTKQDLERIFDCTLSDDGYDDLKKFIDYLMEEK